MAKHLLLVDDSRVATMVLKRTILEVAPDSPFAEAGDGDEALKLLADDTFDMAILDFHMPGMTGLELLEEIRKSNKDLKVSLLTANIQTEIRDRATALDAGFIEKPINKTNLEGLL